MVILKVYNLILLLLFMGVSVFTSEDMLEAFTVNALFIVPMIMYILLS